MESKHKRVAVSVSLSPEERDCLRKIANRYGLSLSAYLRLAAVKYAEREAKL